MQNSQPALRIFACMKTRVDGRCSCGASGASDIILALRKELERRGLSAGHIDVHPSRCLDRCQDAPILVSRDRLQKASHRRANSTKNCSIGQRFALSMFPWTRFPQS
jgi:hypothetical protein